MQLQSICRSDGIMARIPSREELIRSLKSHGLRLTSQRDLIISVLRESSEHLDAEGIWRSVYQRDQSLNLATVYRTLHTLTQVKMVKQSFLGEGQKRAYYELEDKPVHYHFACLNCGKVLELESEQISQAQDALERYYGLRIFQTHLKFEGLCPDCAAPKPNAEQ